MMKKILWLLVVIVFILIILVVLKKCTSKPSPKTTADKPQTSQVQTSETQTQPPAVTKLTAKQISQIKNKLNALKITPEAFKAACDKRYERRRYYKSKLCECDQKALSENGLKLLDYWGLLRSNNETTTNLVKVLPPMKFRQATRECMKSSQ